MSLKIGISGKRYISETDKKKVAEDIKKRIEEILSEHKCARFVGYTSLASGADSIFADITLAWETGDDQKPSLQVVLPFDMAEYEKDFTKEEDLNLLRKYAQCSTSVEIVSKSIPSNRKERSTDYFEAGKHIVDVCDEMIFVWDGQKPDGEGGTADLIGYYSESKSSTAFQYIKIQPENEDPLHGQLQAGLKTAGDEATKYQRKYKSIWIKSIVLGWLAVTCFAFNTALVLEGWGQFVMVGLEFLLVTYVFILIMKAKKRNYHGKYIHQRIRAEKFRVLEVFYLANVPVTNSSLTLQDDRILSGTIQQKINKAITGNFYKSKWHSSYAIRFLIEDQINYHSEKIKKIGVKPAVFDGASLVVGILFFINLSVHLTTVVLKQFFDIDFECYSHEFANLLSIIFTATYAAIEGVLYFEDWHVIKNYREATKQDLLKSLEQLPRDVGTATDIECFSKQDGTLNNVCEIMLSDNKSWDMILEDKSNYRWIV